MISGNQAASGLPGGSFTASLAGSLLGGDGAVGKTGAAQISLFVPTLILWYALHQSISEKGKKHNTTQQNKGHAIMKKCTSKRRLARHWNDGFGVSSVF